MNILNKIIAYKKQEVAKNKELYPVKYLEQSTYFEAQAVSLCAYLKREDKVGVIAEIKRSSPSEGSINAYIDVEQLSIGYMQAGASALSVLTDSEFFGGSNKDLVTARKYNYCPILRKDFMIDEYQIVEAKSIGADAILLIAEVQDSKKTKELAQFAHSLGLEVLLEIHNESELASHPNEYIHAIGVNNRNLGDFSVSLETSAELADQIPDEFTKVSESGISTPEAVYKLAESGYEGFLIGAHFMRHAHPHHACAEFIKTMDGLKNEKALSKDHKTGVLKSKLL
jgi:indole-3-glycerol phosphate synthase